MKRNSAVAACLLAAATVASSDQLPVSLTNQCDRTVRMGVYRIATPATVLGLGTSLNFNGACLAHYNQPWGNAALARVEAGDLDLAYVDVISVTAAANRGANIIVLSASVTLIENCALVARRDIELPADLRHRTRLPVTPPGVCGPPARGARQAGRRAPGREGDDVWSACRRARRHQREGYARSFRARALAAEAAEALGAVHHHLITI